MTDETKVECPNCHKLIPPLKYCVYCGSQLDLETIAAKKDSVEEKTVTCPLCRAEVPRSHNFCHLCGGKLKKQDEASIDSIICPKCWQPNPPAAGNYCIHCGSSIKRWQSKFVREPFQGFSMNLSELFKTNQLIPLASLKYGFSTTRDFPTKGNIFYSDQFSLKFQKEKNGFLMEIINAFSLNSIFSYLLIFLVVIGVFGFWLSSNLTITSNNSDIYQIDSIIKYTLPASLIVAIMLLLPVIIPNYYIYSKRGVKLNYQINYNRIIMIFVMNLAGIFIGLSLPIFIRMGDFKIGSEKVNKKEFTNSTSWGMTMSFLLTILCGVLSMLIVGIPGVFGGIIDVDRILKTAIVLIYLSGMVISLLMLLPIDYLEKIYQQWNKSLYFVFLILFLVMFMHALSIATMSIQMYSTI